MQQPICSQLKHHKMISQIATDRKQLNAEAIKAAGDACDELFKKLAIKRLHIEGDDALEVFKAYFAGTAPFGEPRLRSDIPDAFIHRATIRCAHSTYSSVVAICHDKRLRKALAQIPRVETFEDIKSFL